MRDSKIIVDHYYLTSGKHLLKKLCDHKSLKNPMESNIFHALKKKKVLVSSILFHWFALILFPLNY